jgi:hypothetical protein
MKKIICNFASVFEQQLLTVLLLKKKELPEKTERLFEKQKEFRKK